VCKRSIRNSLYFRLRKNNKSAKILKLLNRSLFTRSRSIDLSFLLSLKYNEFWIDFFTLVDPIIVYIKTFCPKFFDTFKYHFRFI
jgi:hypothetical protein